MRKLLEKAKQGDIESISILMEDFLPIIRKKSTINNKFVYDLFQEQCQVFLKCVNQFDLNILD